MVVGRVFGSPDFSLGAFGEVEEERFVVDTTENLPREHITVRHTSGVMTYTQISADASGDMRLHVTSFHMNSPTTPIFSAEVFDSRDCDFCYTRQSRCECLTPIKLRYKNWEKICNMMRPRRTWKVFTDICALASEAKLWSSVKVWQRIDGAMIKVHESQSTNYFFSNTTGPAIEKKRQDLLRKYISPRLAFRSINCVALDTKHAESSHSTDLLSSGHGRFDRSPTSLTLGAPDSETLEENLSSEDQLVKSPLMSQDGIYGGNCSAKGSPGATINGRSESNLTPIEAIQTPSSSYTKREQKMTTEKRPSKTRYDCQTCSLHFPSKYKINRHIRAVHLRERSFKCHLCTSKYYQKSDLKKHLRSRHGKSGE